MFRYRGAVLSLHLYKGAQHDRVAKPHHSTGAKGKKVLTLILAQEASIATREIYVSTTAQNGIRRVESAKTGESNVGVTVFAKSASASYIADSNGAVSAARDDGHVSGHDVAHDTHVTLRRAGGIAQHGSGVVVTNGDADDGQGGCR